MNLPSGRCVKSGMEVSPFLLRPEVRIVYLRSAVATVHELAPVEADRCTSRLPVGLSEAPHTVPMAFHGITSWCGFRHLESPSQGGHFAPGGPCVDVFPHLPGYANCYRVVIVATAHRLISMIVLRVSCDVEELLQPGPIRHQ